VSPCLAMHYLVVKSSHVRVDVDGLACSLHRSKVYEWQTRGLCCLTGAVMSRRSAMGGGPLFGGAKPPFLDILLAFTKTCLFDKKVIVVIMCVPLVESLCQAMKGWIPTRVPATRRAWGLWPHPVLLGTKCHRFLRPWHLVKSTRYWKLLD
jgi:hypothetical protein